MEKKSESSYDLVVACIGNNEPDEAIINIAYKTSRLSNCKWQVLHIHDKRNTHKNTSEDLKPKIQRVIKKASILQAEIMRLSSAQGVAQGIIDYAKNLVAENKKILFMVGSRKSGLLSLFHKSTYSQVKAQLKKLGIEVKIVTPERSKNKNYTFITPIFNFDGLLGMVEALIAVSVAFVICYLIRSSDLLPFNRSTAHIYLVYIIACAIAALRGGIIPGIISAVLSLLMINFFFLDPIYSFHIDKPSDVFNLLFFFIAASALALIASGSRRYILEAAQKEAYLNALLNVSETLNRHLNENEALSYIHHELEKLFDTEIAFFTPNLMHSNDLQQVYPAKAQELNENEEKAFEICHSEYRGTGCLTSVNPASRWSFEPMMSPNGFQGILAVKMMDSGLRYDSNVTVILLSFADLSATIIDRIEHTQIMEENRIREEKEKLRRMLLSSVSHDLKTPLASIIGSLDVYHNLGDKLTQQDKDALTQTSLQEAQRLDSFITNILDMAKLESGSVKFNKEWHQVELLMDKALNSARSKLGKRTTSHITNNNYEIEVDSNMMLRALAQLLDNISKFTAEDSGILVKYGPDESGGFSITIKDEGPGIEPGMLEEIFNKYTRIKKQDSQIAGTGLGLPISRSIIEEHGGSIVAFNNNGRGASFKITMPKYRMQNAAAA